MKETEERLIEMASHYDYFDEFETDVGWEDWMTQFLIDYGYLTEEEAEEDEAYELNDAQGDAISSYLLECFKEAHKERKMKHYGSQRTHLKLTQKAFRAYSNTDPLDICEIESAGCYRYKMTGVIEGDDLTAEEVNEMLEALN